MPWIPELFSAPVLERLEEKLRRDELATVPYFDGLMAGEPDALIKSFAGEPELYDPVRGRIKGARAFEAFVTEMNTWLKQRNVSVEDAEHVVTERGGFGEMVLHLDAGTGRVDLPVAIVSDRQADGRINELRIYSSSWPLTGRHVNRAPLLQPDPELRASDVVADYQRALTAGDVDAIVAVFEADGYAREPAGGQYIHRGPDGLRTFYELLFSNDGGSRRSPGLSSWIGAGPGCPTAIPLRTFRPWRTSSMISLRCFPRWGQSVRPCLASQMRERCARCSRRRARSESRA